MNIKLIKILNTEDVEVIEQPLRGKLKGLYLDNLIILNKYMKNSKEKTCILAEELGHYYTFSGNILDLSKVENRKQERRACLWAYRKH